MKNNDNQVANAEELMNFLCKFSELLLSWSWEGVSGYEEIIKRISRVYGHDEIKVNFEAQLANIQLGDKSDFVTVGIPAIPPLAHTQLLKDFVSDIEEGKLTLAEANNNLDKIQNKKNPYPPILVWLGVVIISVGFAVDVVGTWQGLLWAGITATATGLVFLAPDKIPGFDKIAALVATFASGLIVMLAYQFGFISAAPGLLLISATFVFIPGDSISLQAYELANGKWSAGVDRLFYSIIMLVLQLTGAYMAVLITGSTMSELFPSVIADTFPWWAAYPGRFVFVIGILLTFQMSKKTISSGPYNPVGNNRSCSGSNNGMGRTSRYIYSHRSWNYSGALAGTKTTFYSSLCADDSNYFCTFSWITWITTIGNLGVGANHYRNKRLKYLTYNYARYWHGRCCRSYAWK